MSAADQWKLRLLATGLPFEIDIARVLADVGFRVLAGFEFSIPAANGGESQRSIDFTASAETASVPLTLMVECKFRRPGVIWYFDPPGFGHISETDWLTNALVSPLVAPWMLPAQHLCPPVVEFGHHPPLDTLSFQISSRAVELKPKNPSGADNKGYDSPTDKDIRTALFQLRYAVSVFRHASRSPQAHHFDQWLISGDFRFLLPIVVTTASLRVIAPGAGVEAVRNASRMEDVTQEVGAIVVRTELPLAVQRLNADLFSKVLADANRDESWHASVDAWRTKQHELVARKQSTFADLNASYGARRILVVNAVHLPAVLTEFMSALDDTARLAPHATSSIPGRGHVAFPVNAYARRQAQVGRAPP